MKSLYIRIKTLLITFVVIWTVTMGFFYIYLSIDVLIFNNLAQFETGDIRRPSDILLLMMVIGTPILSAANAIVLLFANPFIRVLPIYQNRWLLTYLGLANNVLFLLPSWFPQLPFDSMLGIGAMVMVFASLGVAVVFLYRSRSKIR